MKPPELQERIEKARLEKVRELKLPDEKIKELPDTMAGLSHLEILDLSRNKLTIVPDWIGQLTNLKVLILHGNQLKTLPLTIGNCKALEKIDLGNNRIEVFPEGLKGLPELHTLKLYNDKLKEIPEWIDTLSKLEELSIEGNSLSTLPESLGGLSTLEYLSLGGNKFKEIPAFVGNMSTLLGLDLDNNKLSSLPFAEGQLSKLTSLNLEGNRFTEVPAFIAGLTSLEMLWLSENQISSLPGSMGNLTNLTWLGIHENPIEELPDEFIHLNKLESFLVAGTPIGKKIGNSSVLMGGAEISGFIKKATPSVLHGVQLTDVYELLESRDEDKIKEALEHLEANSEYKSAAEKRYLKFIQVRLGNPDAGLEAINAASLTLAEEKLLMGGNLSSDFITYEYLDGDSSKVIVDFLGAMIAKYIDIEAHIKELSQIPNVEQFRTHLSQIQGQVVRSILKEGRVYSEGWYGKVFAKMSLMNLSKVMFDHTTWDEANQSTVLKEYMFFLSAFTRIETTLYMDIFQSDTPDLTSLFWMMLRVPTTVWGDVEPAFPKSKLRFVRSSKVRSGDFGRWKTIKSELESPEPEVDEAATNALNLLESVLQESYGLGPEQYKEGEDWFRFEIKECKFQAGLKPMKSGGKDHLYFVVHLNEIDHEEDLDKVLAVAKKASRKASGSLPQSFKLEYLDGYFAFQNFLSVKSSRGKVPVATDITEAIENMVAFANHEEIQAVNGEYRGY